MRTICTGKNATGANRWRFIYPENSKGWESGRDPDRQIERDLYNRLFQRGARFAFAAAAAIRTARTGLQFGKTPHPVGSSASDVVIGNGVAQANVHDAYFQRECE
jgi:hypothetical protein